MREYMIMAVMTMLILPAAASASLCLDGSTLMENFTSNGNLVNLTFTCAHGCVNDACIGANFGLDLNLSWFVLIIGIVMIVFSLVLGVPSGSVMNSETAGNPIAGVFNIRALSRYLFFFVGIMFVYMALSMIRGVSGNYGATTGTTGAVDTVVMVVLWMVVIFIMAFMVELLFSLTTWLANWKNYKKEKKWGGRDI